jgi:hypothetical protein
MTSRFRKPVKRSRRLLQKDDDSIEHHITNIEDLVKKKKIKVEREKTLKSLFQELEQERINQEEYDMYGYKEQQPVELKPIEDIVFDDDYLLESDAEDVEENEIKEAAKGYLQLEEQENLEHVFQRTKEADEIHKMETDWKRPFFRSGMKYIRQPCLISRESTCGQKEIHLSELSSSKSFYFHRQKKNMFTKFFSIICSFRGKVLFIRIRLYEGLVQFSLEMFTLYLSMAI